MAKRREASVVRPKFYFSEVNIMYKLQVWFKRHWKWSVKEYSTIEEAEARIEELRRIGIKARVRLSSEQYK